MITDTLDRTALRQPTLEQEVKAMKYGTKTQAQVERHIAYLVNTSRAIEPIQRKQLYRELFIFIEPVKLKELYDAFHQTGQGLADIQRVEHAWLDRFGKLFDRLVERKCLVATTFAHHDVYVPGPDYIRWNYHRDEPIPAKRLEDVIDFGDDAASAA